MVKVKGLFTNKSEPNKALSDEGIIKLEVDIECDSSSEDIPALLDNRGTGPFTPANAMVTKSANKNRSVQEDALQSINFDLSKEQVIEKALDMHAIEEYGNEHHTPKDIEEKDSPTQSIPLFSIARWQLKDQQSFPSQVVTHQQMRYLFSKANKEWTKLSFSCASKHLTKCVAKCQIQVVVDSKTGERKMELLRWSNMEDHNHQTSKAEIVLIDMNNKIDEKALIYLFEKPEEIRRQVIAEFEKKFGSSSEWPAVVEQLQGEEAITRRVARNRKKLVAGHLA
jgi:hypothetical protein